MRFQNTEGQWIVQLTINNLKKEDTLVTYKLEVENSQGKNEYEVRLETDNEPGPGMFCHLSQFYFYYPLLRMICFHQGF